MRLADFDVKALVQFVAVSKARRVAIQRYIAALDTEGTTLFQALRTIGAAFDPDSPSNANQVYRKWEYKGRAGGAASHWSLLHGEAIRFRGWAEGEGP